MRIAIVSPYALSVFGGVQEQVLAMSRELSARGHHVLVVAPDQRDDTAYDTPADVARFGSLLSIPANGSRAPLTLSWRAARAANKYVQSFGPDLVHFHEPFAPLVGWSLLRDHRCAAVGTFHRSGGGPAFSLTRPLLARLRRGLDATAAVSEAARDTITANVALEPELLFNGFETERFREFPREAQETPTLLVVGRLESRKGVRVALEAVLAHNRESRTPWRLVIIGDGPERGELESLAASDDNILLLGRVDDEGKRRWLRRADALLCPALRGESFGLVLLEGMAAETPVVASDIDGYRQASGGHATLVAPGNVEAWTKAIARVLESPHDTAAAVRHAQEWSMASLVTRYEELYARAQRDFKPTK